MVFEIPNAGYIIPLDYAAVTMTERFIDRFGRAAQYKSTAIFVGII